MKENSHRLMLAYSSPLFKSSAVQNLGKFGEGQLSRNTLWSRTEIESTDECHKDLMKLFHNSTCSRMHPFIIAAQWNDHWSHVEEKTTSSTSGIQHEHCIAHTASSLILIVKCDLVNLAIKNSYPLGTWKRGSSVILEKAPGN